MERAKFIFGAALFIVFGPPVAYSENSHNFQIDAHICQNNKIISSTHALVSRNKKLYYAPRPELVFWYEVSRISNRIRVEVEYRRNTENTVTWEKGPSFELLFDELTIIKLAAENGEEMDWHILVRQNESSHQFLNLESTSIRKECN